MSADPLTVLAWAVPALALTVVLWGVLRALAALRAQLRALQAEQRRLAEAQSALREALAAQDARADGLGGELRALLDCSLGVGEAVHRQARELRALAQRQEQLALRGPGDETYRHAAALTEKGASAEEIVRRCGLSHGEAELLAHLNTLRQERARLRQSA